jgi:3-oxoacyl-[acyl-carrier-protein] synthase II
MEPEILHEPVALTGVGVVSPLGNDLQSLRKRLLENSPHIEWIQPRYMNRVPAGVCGFDETKHRSRKEIRRGTRAGTISIYCAREALADAGIDIDALEDKQRTGVYIGIAEHGNVEVESEIANLKAFDYDIGTWPHHPRSIANNPAGETCIALELPGPHCCIGAACAAGNYGIVHGAQQLLLGEVDLAIAGGVSESIHTFVPFASFQNQGALAMNDDPNRACRPLDRHRTGVVLAEGGCLFTMERLSDARSRGAHIHGIVAGWAINTDATSFTLPNELRQAEAMARALKHAGLKTDDVDLINLHATGTREGDPVEVRAVRHLFGKDTTTLVNATKGFIGHTLGAAGALELAGNLPSFVDKVVHPCANLDEVDPECSLPGLVVSKPARADRLDTILNNSFGILGINVVLIVSRYKEVQS